MCNVTDKCPVCDKEVRLRYWGRMFTIEIHRWELGGTTYHCEGSHMSFLMRLVICNEEEARKWREIHRQRLEEVER